MRGWRGIREAAAQQRCRFWPASTSAATTRKFEAGAAAFREKLEGRKKDLFREDRETAQRFASQLALTHQEALMALAITLVAQTEYAASCSTPFGRPPGDYVEGWSYEAGATTRVREILGVELRTSRTGVHYLDDELPESAGGGRQPGRPAGTGGQPHGSPPPAGGEVGRRFPGNGRQEVHIFNTTDEQRQLAVVTGRKQAEALCGETVGIQEGVGQDNKTLWSKELQKRLCLACQETLVGKMDTVSQGTTSPETLSEEVKTA